jgi:amidase
MSGATATRSAATHATADAVFVRRLDLGADGLSVGVKDSIDIAGYPTQAASATLADAPAALAHAAVVHSLLDGGCRIVGKTNMHELAYGVTGINRFTGTPMNPRYPTRVPGGSSSGSAVAVASGVVDFAIGTDTGGSIRIPAACCGVYGLKPTYGRVSRAGAHPANSSLDCIGPFARDSSMLERAMALIDPTFITQAPPLAARVGLVAVDADPAISAAVARSLRRAEFTVLSRQLPTLARAYTAALHLVAAETLEGFGHLLESDAMGADVRARLLAARELSAADLAAAESCRAQFRAEVDAALEGVDALALPTMPVFPPTLEAAGDARAALSMTALVRPFNLSGHPALTIPLEPRAPLPAALQLVGRWGADASLCALAHRIVADPEAPC